MNKQLKEDIEALVRYNIEEEENDFREHILSETYVSEEGILTDEEFDDLIDADAEEAENIIEKAASHPKIDHIYSVIYRISQSLKEENDGI